MLFSNGGKISLEEIIDPMYRSWISNKKIKTISTLGETPNSTVATVSVLLYVYPPPHPPVTINVQILTSILLIID